MHSAFYLFGALLLTGADARCVKISASTTSTALPSSSSASRSLSSATEPSSTLSSIILSSASSTLSSIASTSSAGASTSTSQSLVSSETSVASSSEASTTTGSQSLVSSETAAPSSSASTAGASTSTSSTSVPTATNYARNYVPDVVDKLRDSSMSNLEEYLKQNPSGKCTLETASIRREWGDLSDAEREDYIAAVQCLQSKPSLFEEGVAPGAKSRFDDFVAVHISMTDDVHFVSQFLSWHRYLLWTYEKALREDCGYTGYQPYWNWDRYAKDPENSPLFNGNSTSLSGNSVRGACVTSGPFKDMKVNLGPGASLRHNPRCLKRDISKSWASQCTADKTNSLITRSTTIASFQDTMQSFNGVHGGGHFTIGGDPGGDLHASNGDPAFYLHHGMIDRIWWIWQMQDLPTRLAAVGGRTSQGRPGSLDEDVDISILGKSVKLGELLNTMGGKGGDFCYIYL
ncbi:hypothetical protein DL764_003772 [Monosporascus ibericus]|uniref:Tyrosinase copper-binding domain-containing protein n=1 Tax=Monosporascus ibericus TaxID=155417 RepID=A0A4Q4TH39_9PEZI|nr:hypothetical protein DL764_003772 [Monosporascus ibericus]